MAEPSRAGIHGTATQPGAGPDRGAGTGPNPGSLSTGRELDAVTVQHRTEQTAEPLATSEGTSAFRPDSEDSVRFRPVPVLCWY